MFWSRVLGSLRYFEGALIIGGSVAVTAFPTVAGTSGQITITREVLLEGGTATAPRSITQTHDGSYVITGSKGRAWATRVDSGGTVQWRHEATISPKGGGVYAGAAVLPDDSVMLCGYQRVPEQAGTKISGLLTHIDKTGHVLSERLIEPNDGQYHGLNHLSACVATGDQILVLGDTYLAESRAMSCWTLVLEASGRVKHENLSALCPKEARHVRLLPSGDVVFTAEVFESEPGVLIATRVGRMDASGVIQVRGPAIPRKVLQAVPMFSDPAIRLFPAAPTQGKTILTLNDQLNDVSQAAAQVEPIISMRAYYLPDGSFVLFGKEEYRRIGFTASIAWVSPNLKKRNTVLLQPPLAADTIVDAIPTGAFGEFATVREVGPITEAGHTEKRLGAVLAFIQVN